MKKILVIQTAFLGDVVLATALVEQLHASFPDAQISMLIRNGNEGLLKEHPFLSKVYVWKKNQNKLSSMMEMLRAIRHERFDLVVNLQRFFSSGIFTAFSNGVTTVGFDKNPLSFLFTRKVRHVIGDGRHEIDRNAELIASICKVGRMLPRLYPSETNDVRTQPYKGRPYVTMAPASVWFTKQLPESKWVELLKNISSQKQVFLVGGPDDAGLCDRIIHQSGISEAVNLCGKLNLLDTVSLMRDAAMNYVNDSGPLHLASSVNAPVTAFFCSTIPAFGFGPLSERSTVLEVKAKLDCRPCGLHGKTSCPQGHFRCGFDIKLPSMPD